MPSIVHSFTISGIDGIPVEIETSTQYGKPQLLIIGLGDQAVREASERIQSAIEVSGLKVPKMKIVINLAPGDLRKQGSHFELGMAIGLLKQTQQLAGSSLPYFALFGELSLDGRLRGCSGILPMVLAARENGLTMIIVPQENLLEAAVVQDVHVFGFTDLKSVVDFLDGRATGVTPAETKQFRNTRAIWDLMDFGEIRGQEDAIQAALLAAAGGHNLLLTGSPGCGKTMIAQRIPSILPPLSQEESTEVTKIHSIAGLLSRDQGWVEERPFRAPHHNISLNALIGGGATAVPGEVSLAHHGVLFLDELTEHAKRTLDALRQPLEDGYVTISRVKASHRYPSQFMLVGAMNPCPCGYGGSFRCKCSPSDLQRYRNRISGPLLDRIDLHLFLAAVPIQELISTKSIASSHDLQQQVERARYIQTNRYKDIPGIHTNSRMGQAHIQAFCHLESDALQVLHKACEASGSSARNYNRLLRISRTLADLEGSGNIRNSDVVTALRYQHTTETAG